VHFCSVEPWVYPYANTWTASRKGICFPTLSYKLALEMEMGEMVIPGSNTSKSLSIRASSFDMGSFSATYIMIGSMVAMKNTCK
jgi:hypothetical protein